jgi:heat shock protein HslJ
MKHLLPLTLALLAGCTVIPRGAPPPVPSEPSSSDSYSALGTEPGWTLKVTPGRLSYEGDYGATRIDVPRPEPRTTFNGHRYETARLTVDVTHGECSDGMSDRLYEDSVTVTADGKTVKGCGGAILSPQTLEGTDWVILRVGEMDALADRPAEIAFTNGRVSGTTGCNRFSGSYDVNTTALTLGPLAATKMACPGTAMEQENKLLAILKGTIGMTFRNGDTLILTGANGRTVTLRRKI